MDEERFERSFVDSDLWQPGEFRACLARESLSIKRFRQRLIEDIGEIGVPSSQTIRNKWYKDKAVGPQNIVLVISAARVLKVSTRVLLCPRLGQGELEDLAVTGDAIERALGFLEYASRLGSAIQPASTDD